MTNGLFMGEWGVEGETDTTFPATQVLPRGVKAGLGAHDAGASGRRETRHSSTESRADLWSRTTPRPTILGDPIVNTASKANCVLMDRAWNRPLLMFCVFSSHALPWVRSTRSRQAQSLPRRETLLRQRRAETTLVGCCVDVLCLIRPCVRIVGWRGITLIARHHWTWGCPRPQIGSAFGAAVTRSFLSGSASVVGSQPRLDTPRQHLCRRQCRACFA